MMGVREIVPESDGRIDRRDKVQGRVRCDQEAPRIRWRAVAIEHQIIEVLDARPEPGERIEFAFRRKEHELMSLFAQLSVIDALELHRRLRLSLSDDPLASRFGRLVVDRRARLMSYLADARRREALKRAR